MPEGGGPVPEGAGGFNFDDLRRFLERFGITPGSEADLSGLIEQFARMQASGGPGFGFTNADRDPDAAWRTTITAAKQLAQAASPEPPADPATRLKLTDAERLAQSWLNPQTTFPETGLPPELLGRADWLEETGEGWRQVVEPIIQGLGNALERGATAGGQEELAGLTAMLGPLLQHSASLIYRDRLKRVLSEVACSTLTGTEVGINLLPRARVAVLPANVAEFTQDLDVSEPDVLLYLVLRESARVRLFHHVAWLEGQLATLLAHFAREIVIDLDAISSGLDPEAMEQFSIEDIMEVGERVRSSFFKPASTPTQMEILGRLEVLLALIEGWVDHVTSRTAAAWLPNANQLNELIRRRRASGGATQEVFRNLIGLEPRPRLVRDAENLWAAIEHSQGMAQRDAVWQHPDLLPTAKHLADPLSYRTGNMGQAEPDDMDVELRKLLEG